MSARAIRALRGESALPIVPSTEDELAEDDEDDSEEETKPIRSAAFAMIDDSDDSDEDESSTSDGGSNDIATQTMEKDTSDRVNNTLEASKQIREDVQSVEHEDLDSLLTEFQQKDLSRATEELSLQKDTEGITTFDLIIKGLNVRDLDYDHTLRNSLSLGRIGESSALTPTLSTQRPERPRKSSPLFGPPADGWVRPPRLVGGGIGMTTYEAENGSVSISIPWPYNSSDVDLNARLNTHWYTFIHSDSHARDLLDYVTVIQESGNLDALILFLAHHPYVTPALLQLVSVCYQTNHSQEGLALLRRCLWIFESSALASFHNRISGGNACFMDHARSENAAFFRGLFRLIQVSNVAGLSRTCWAASRLLLSMDPLRDPMNVLLALDHHSLATASGSTATEQLSILRWMIDFVDSGMVDIWYRDEASYRCSLQSLPNWAYSYSLALFQIHKLLETYALDAEGLGPSLVKARADEAIQQALTRFPSVVGLLLSSLEVDTTGRSFQRDWVSVLDATSDRARQLVRQWHAECEDTVVLAATLQSCDLIVKIFVQQNAKLWSDTETLQWLYDNLKDVVANYGSGAHPPPPNPAIMRYAGADPTDYDNKIQTLPPDANIINPAMLEHAMYMQPNRPRFLRHHMRPQNGDDGGVRVNDGNNVLVDANGNRIMNNLFMGPPTQVINPDWPMLEVFWRSFLPWNRVEGVPPARR